MALSQRNGTGLSRSSEGGFMPLSQAMQRLVQDSFLLPSFFEQWGGASSTVGTNLWEAGDSYLVQVAMPGMRPDSIQCTVEQGLLSVKGEPALSAPEGATPLWQSFGGPAEYHIQVPGEVDSGAAAANYDAGVLTIRLPKAQHARARTIAVTAK